MQTLGTLTLKYHVGDPMITEKKNKSSIEPNVET